MQEEEEEVRVGERFKILEGLIVTYTCRMCSEMEKVAMPSGMCKRTIQ